MLSHGSPLSSICPPGSKRNLCFVARQRDDIAVLLLRLPAEALDQLAQNKVDAALTEIGNRLPRIAVDTDFFVFGADPPTLARLAGIVEVGFELVLFLNDRHGCEYFADRADGSHPFP